MFWLDFLFPPFCLACQERSSTKYLCPDCWQLSELPDPALRCRHCFEELYSNGDLCSQCRKNPILSAVRAAVFDPNAPARFLGLEPPEGLASFAIYQWIQLEWPLPDAVIPMPDSVSIAKVFADTIQCPFIRALKGNCEYRVDCLEEEGILLLIDRGNPIEKIQKAIISLSESFPKRIYLLTLFSLK